MIERTTIDVVIPVYNEGDNIMVTLGCLASEVQTCIRVLICYDHDDDDTLSVIRKQGTCGLEIVFVKNRGNGAHGAVMTGLEASSSVYVLVYPADDECNASILDEIFRRAAAGSHIVCASRFMKRGSMEGCPWLKEMLTRVAGFTLYHVGRVPTHDSTYGLRLFSRKLLQTVVIESSQGFTYSIELLGKCHRLGWPIDEVPARWIERTRGKSRFKVIQWIPAYLRWYLYILETTFLAKGPDSVPRKK